jgi:hypothetical protein
MHMHARTVDSNRKPGVYAVMKRESERRTPVLLLLLLLLLLFALSAAALGVSRADAERAYLGDLAGTPTGQGGAEVPFTLPVALTVDGANDLWVIDQPHLIKGSARIDEFGPSGTFLNQGSGKEPGSTKEKKEVEEATKSGKIFCSSKSSHQEWLDDLWDGAQLESIAFSPSSGHLYLADGEKGQLWVLGSEDCPLQEISGSWNAFERGGTADSIQAAVDDSSDPFRGDIYVSSPDHYGNAAEGEYSPEGIYRVAPEGNSKGHSVTASFECLAPYIEEPPLGVVAGRIIVGAPTGPGGAVERFEEGPGSELGSPLVVDPATGNVFAVAAGGVDEFEPSGCFVRRITAPTGGLGIIQAPIGTVSSGIAFDPVTGHLLVSGAYLGNSSRHSFIDEFSSSGVLLDELTETDGVGAESAGIAVNSSGDMFVAVRSSGVVDEFGQYKASPAYPVEVKESGSGTVTSEPEGIDCPSTCSADFSRVKLTEAPGAGFAFASWKVEGEAVVAAGCTGTDTTCEIVVNGPAKVGVVFESELAPVEVVESGSGSGTVTSEPPGIGCPSSTCKAEFTKGKEVELKEEASAGSSFKGWKVEGEAVVGAGCTGTEEICKFEISGPVKIEAIFESEASPDLTVEEPGTGSGTVTSKPSGIDCPSTCSAPFTKGETVELKEKENAGSSFKDWKVEGEAVVSAGCTGTEEICKFEVNGPVKVEVGFESNSAPVEVEEPGTGSGTVTSKPSGIDCPSTCSAPFTKGETVELKEKENAGSTFAGWDVVSGTAIAGCTGTETTCSVTAPGKVRVIFDSKQVLVEAQEPGFGSGTVTSAPGGIDCHGVMPTCAGEFGEGETVVLTATAAPGSSFTEWVVDPGADVSAGCQGTEATCTVKASGPVAVRAMFAPVLDGLSVSVSGVGSVGSREGVSAGPIVDCTATGGTCAAEPQEGTLLTLTERPGTGQRFAGWSGACEGLGECRVMVAAATMVGAKFEPIPPEPEPEPETKTEPTEPKTEPKTSSSPVTSTLSVVSPVTVVPPGKEVTKPKARPLTRAQMLAKALKACRSKPKSKRRGCEAAARKHYAAKPNTKTKAKRQTKEGRS